MDTAIQSRFRASLIREGLAEGTQTKYTQHVREWVDRLGGDEAVLAATRQDAEDYLDWLIAEQKVSVATLRLRIASLRKLYVHLEERELLAGRNPFAHIKPPKSKRKPNDWLHPDEDEAVYQACVAPQERILHALLRYAGLRIGEATALVQRNVDLDNESIHVTVSKTDSGLRTIPIHPRLRKELEMWFARLERIEKRRPDLPVLVTKNSTPMKAAFGWRLVKRVAGRADVRTIEGTENSAVTPHTLRRTFGTDLLNSGMRIESVSKLLGHRDTRVTLDSYAELLPDTIRAEAQEAWGA